MMAVPQLEQGWRVLRQCGWEWSRELWAAIKVRMGGSATCR